MAAEQSGAAGKLRRLGAAGVPGGGPGSAGGRWARRAGRWRGPQLPVPVSLLRALQKWRGGVVTNLIIRNRQKIWLYPSTSLSTLRPPSAQKSGWSNEVFWVCRRAGRALIASKKVHIFFGVFRLCQHFFTDASVSLSDQKMSQGHLLGPRTATAYPGGGYMVDGCWFPELPAGAVGVPVTTSSSSWGMTQQQEQQPFLTFFHTDLLLLHQQASGFFYGNNMQDDNNNCHYGAGVGLLYGGWYSEAGCHPYPAMVCVCVCARARMSVRVSASVRARVRVCACTCDTVQTHCASPLLSLLCMRLRERQHTSDTTHARSHTHTP